MKWRCRTERGHATGCRRRLLCCALLFCATPAFSAVSETEVLKTQIDKGATPTLAKMAATARTLQGAVDHLCAAKNDAALEQARRAWVDGYLAWRRAAPFLFGPAKRIRPMYRVGRWWMLNDKVLEAVVTSEEYKGLRGNIDVHGFAAVEYLLFTPRDAAAAATDLRCLMLKQDSSEVAEALTQVNAEWLSSKTGDKVMAAGDGKPFLLPADALETTMGQAINVADQMLRDSVGLPSGYFNSIAKPDILEAWHSRQSLPALKAALSGLRLAVQGENNITGLIAAKDGLLNKRNPELAKQLVTRLDAVEEEINDLGGDDFDLHAALAKKPKLLKPLYDSIHDLQDTLIEASLQLELDIMMPGEVGD